MTRDRAEMVREIVDDLKIRARVCGLKRLARETSALYENLVAHGVPDAIVTSYFAVGLMRERLDEQRRGRSG
ncbi:hypothetical protein [Bradyrhizobium macuxiense]|nr:hypothetical protein [Bradyrhizobium macuxiense]